MKPLLFFQDMSTYKTDVLVAELSKCGVLADMPYFSCTHYPELSPEGYGQTAFEFADFGQHHVTLRFIFRGDGEISLAGCPNQWSEYQYAEIFCGQSDSATENLLAFSIESIPIIKNTLELYTTSVPHEDYSDLLELWSHVHPKLLDKKIEPHIPHPWWKIW